MALKLLLRTVARGRKAQIVFHGSDTSLNGWRSRNPIRRIQDERTALTLGSNRNIQYILLEQPSREALLHHVHSLEKHTGVLDFPVATRDEHTRIVEFVPPFKFGLLGMPTEDKGFRLFLEAAAALTAKIPELVEFHAIGFTDEKWESFEINPLVTKPRTDKQWPRSEYIRQVEKLHFVCLPYQGQLYELSPTGTLLDAIAWEKPIIGTPIPIIENLVARFGDIGYICANKNQFCETILRIVKEKDVDRYREQVLAMRKVRFSRSPRDLASTYRDLCSRLLSL
jgi:glycosyltransferase involved in cell wall biosynthesis